MCEREGAIIFKRLTGSFTRLQHCVVTTQGRDGAPVEVHRKLVTTSNKVGFESKRRSTVHNAVNVLQIERNLGFFFL